MMTSLAAALLTILTLTSPTAARQITSPPGNDLRFIALSLDDDKNLRWERYTIAKDKQTRLSEGKVELPLVRRFMGNVLDRASRSPNGRWVALGIGSRDQFGGRMPAYRLFVLDTTDFNIFFQTAVDTKLYGQEFAWSGRETLRFHRKLTVAGRESIATYEVRAPRWVEGESVDDDLPGWIIPKSSAKEEDRKWAADLLTRAGYGMTYGSPEQGGLRKADHLWETPAKLLGYTGAVSPDRRVIATVITTKDKTAVPGGSRFIVLREEQNWKEETVSVNRHIEHVEFWGDYLLLSASVDTRQSVTILRLSDLTKVADVQASAVIQGE